VVDALAKSTPQARAVRERLRDSGPLAAPHIVDLEVTNALRRQVRAEQLDEAEAHRAVARLRRLPLRRFPHVLLLRRCWELRDNVTPYDAAYVALAEALGVPLLTADSRLAKATGIRCEVELVT
jgi:predicted nucleic acid-binding protein